MQVKAAVTLGYQQPFVIKDVDVSPPGKDEILVKIVATGVCHTDAVMRDNPGVVPMPAILGHEGAGIVASVGEAVSGIRVGDHVGAQLCRLPPLRKLFKQPPFSLRRF
ncbi:Zn-dependent alcohol dehydrogenase [Klebsiella variicola]|nr:Zn-dependent alcohol dehydrogenase [Klebsiella variicola]